MKERKASETEKTIMFLIGIAILVLGIVTWIQILKLE